MEAVIVHVTHKRSIGESPVSMTNEQIAEIVAERHPDVSVKHPKTFEELKRRYITREKDGKPASRFELLREIRKGERKPGQSIGIPSDYETTGILRLLTP